MFVLGMEVSSPRAMALFVHECNHKIMVDELKCDSIIPNVIIC